MTEVFKRGPIELRLGRWQDVLADVTECDAVITDPPYSAMTHDGHNASVAGHAGHGKDNAKRQSLGYAAWDRRDVARFVAEWARCCRGWIAALTSHDLAPAYRDSFGAAGLYSFAPIPFVSPGSRCRLSGDGPSGWTAWIMVARPPSLSRWGTLPGWYDGPTHRGEMSGGKPLWLMRAIIRDYSRPGDLIVDPCAGGATTLIAAAIEGRRAIGAECDPDTFAKAVRRIEAGHTPDLFAGA